MTPRVEKTITCPRLFPCCWIFDRSKSIFDLSRKRALHNTAPRLFLCVDEVRGSLPAPTQNNLNGSMAYEYLQSRGIIYIMCQFFIFPRLVLLNGRKESLGLQSVQRFRPGGWVLPNWTNFFGRHYLSFLLSIMI